MLGADDHFYRMFYFVLFSYAIYTCISGCVQGARRDRSSGGSDNNNNNNTEERGNAESDENDPGKRRDLVRARLEFRTITEDGITLSEDVQTDLETGGGESAAAAVAAAATVQEEEVAAAAPANVILAMLTDMGFSANASIKSINAAGVSDLEAAMDWLFDHQDDLDLDDPPVPSSNRSGKIRTEIPVAIAEDDNDNDNSNDDDARVTSEDNRLDTTNSGIGASFSSIMNLFSPVGNNNNNINSTNIASKTIRELQGQECCSICLEPFRVGDTIARLKPKNSGEGGEDSNSDQHNGCNHWFHEDCIMEWLQNNDECPLCRVNMIHS